MPAPVFIIRHWRKEQELFLGNLNILRLEDQSEAVHDLRVSFKKIRSYQELLNIIFKKDNDELSFVQTEQLFSVLGKLRDIERGLLLLEEFGKDNGSCIAFRQHLKTVLQQATVWARDTVKGYDETDLTDMVSQVQQNLKGTGRQELLDKIRIVIDKELKETKQLARHLDRHPHLVRKRLKNTFYWAMLAPGNILLNQEEATKIKKTLAHLGDWQDVEMLLRKVKHFRKDFVPDHVDEYVFLKELERQLKDKAKKMLEKAKDNT